MSNSVSHKLYIIVESAYGTTPSTPTMVEIPITGCTFSVGINQLLSETIRSDRQLVDVRNGTRSVTGDITAELQYGVLDDLLEAATCGTWATDTPSAGIDQLKPGTTKRSFSVLRHFTDLGSGDNPYELYTGVEIASMAITAGAEQISSVSFSVVGQNVTFSDSAPSGSTLTDVDAVAGFDAFTGALNEGGSALGTATEFSISLENGQEPRFVIGATTTIEPELKKSNLTGSISTHFEDHAQLTKFVGDTKSNTDITLTDPAGNTLYFEVPNFLYTGGQPDVSGESDVILSLPYQAIYDATTSTNLIIQRNPA